MTATLTAPSSPTPPAVAPHITFADYLAMDDDVLHELLNGKLEEIPMSALASNVALELGWKLRSHANPLDLGRLFGSEMIYRCFPWKPDNGRRPDLSFIAAARLPEDWMTLGYFTLPPDLAVEVLSPNDLAYNINAKLAEYLRANVRLVWIIDPEQRMVFVHRAEGSSGRLNEGDELSGEDVIPGFRCRVADLFPPQPSDTTLPSAAPPSS